MVNECLGKGKDTCKLQVYQGHFLQVHQVLEDGMFVVSNLGKAKKHC